MSPPGLSLHYIPNVGAGGHGPDAAFSLCVALHAPFPGLPGCAAPSGLCCPVHPAPGRAANRCGAPFLTVSPAAPWPLRDCCRSPSSIPVNRPHGAQKRPLVAAQKKYSCFDRQRSQERRKRDGNPIFLFLDLPQSAQGTKAQTDRQQSAHGISAPARSLKSASQRFARGPGSLRTYRHRQLLVRLSNRKGLSCSVSASGISSFFW